MLPWKISFLQNDSIIVDNSARRQCIVFLSLLVVLFEGNLLEWGQLFSRKIYGEGAIFLGGNFVHGQLSSGAIIRGTIIREAIFLGDNCPRTMDKHWKKKKIFCKNFYFRYSINLFSVWSWEILFPIDLMLSGASTQNSSLIILSDKHKKSINKKDLLKNSQKWQENS